MRWTVPFPMFPPAHLLALAPAAEDAGFDAIAMPDSVWFPEKVTGEYPYSPDGSRFWEADTPFVDPFIGIAAMAALTSRIGFYTNVVKLPIRNPLLVAKQVSSMACLSNNRFALGVGVSWMPEEFRWTNTDKKTRGARTDEMIQIIKLVCAGNGPEWVEFHGAHYDFDKLIISPAPDAPVPIYVGGHAEPSLRRAATLGDGWVSANSNIEELAGHVATLHRLRHDAGRADETFTISVLAMDAWDLDSYRRLGDLGVTDIQVVPWFMYGGDPNALETQRDSFYRFADDVIAKY